MNFANPHFFSAILEGIPHRFILIQESESLQGSSAKVVPRFTLGGVNASRDPRYSDSEDLSEIGATNSLVIPFGYLMAHQYIYTVHENTDESGWQFRSQWSDGVLKPGDEPWTSSPLASSNVRRRIWFTTIVERDNLTVAKRLLSDNIRVDTGGYKMQGELLRFEKGTLTKSWQKRRIALANNRLEFYSGSTKKGEVPLNDCEVKMLFENQCPGKNFAFSIRNPMGDVGVLLDAESKDSRRKWVMAIQYQLAINSSELNFAPLEYAPPTGEVPDNRVILCGDLSLQGKDSEDNIIWSPRHFQLLPREIIYFEEETLMGRIFVANAKITGDNKSLNFQIESASGITLNLSADSPESKNMWLLGVNKQIQFIENQKLKIENLPKEEQNDALVPVSEQMSQFYDEKWTAPTFEGENDKYYSLVLNPDRTSSDAAEFTELVPAENTTTREDFEAEKNNEEGEEEEETFEEDGPNGNTVGERKSANMTKQSARASGSKELSNTVNADGSRTMSSTTTQSKSMSQQKSSSTSTSTRTSSGSASAVVAGSSGSGSGSDNVDTGSALKTLQDANQGEVLSLNPRRSLINPKFILTVLKGVTHRFLLAMESESLLAPSVETKKPPRFTVGGPRASKDPRTTPVDELIPITSDKPEIQLPPGWVMIHQYINIIQQNTDDDGWQYRSNWSEGAVTSKDEQWIEKYNSDSRNVRRRLWMTTVVKKDDVIRAKKLVFDSLNGSSKRDVILQSNLYRYRQELGQSSTSWQRRKVLLYHNKLEFYIGNERKGEAELAGCVVKILFGVQCPGRSYAFSLRNSSGSVNVLLEAESAESRLRWVRAIYYQIAILTPDVNFPPFTYGPPSGELLHNRTLFCGDLIKNETKMHFQLKYNLLIFFQRSDKILGRLNLEQASLTSNKEDTGNEFAVRFGSGYILTVTADSPETKLAWVRAIRRQVLKIESDRTVFVNTPPEELMDDMLSCEQRFHKHHDEKWGAPRLEFEAEQAFDKRELEKLDKLKNTEVWDGSQKAVSRPSSLMISPSSSPGGVHGPTGPGGGGALTTSAGLAVARGNSGSTMSQVSRSTSHEESSMSKEESKSQTQSSTVAPSGASRTSLQRSTKTTSSTSKSSSSSSTMKKTSSSTTSLNRS